MTEKSRDAWTAKESIPTTARLPATFTLLVGARLHADLARHPDAAELMRAAGRQPNAAQPTDQADRLIRAALQAVREALGARPVPQPLAA
jgi:hypothetical protein